MWLGYFAMCAAARLPWGMQRAFGRFVGWLARLLIPERRRAARINIALA